MDFPMVGSNFERIRRLNWFELFDQIRFSDGMRKQTSRGMIKKFQRHRAIFKPPHIAGIKRNVRSMRDFAAQIV